MTPRRHGLWNYKPMSGKRHTQLKRTFRRLTPCGKAPHLTTSTNLFSISAPLDPGGNPRVFPLATDVPGFLEEALGMLRRADK